MRRHRSAAGPLAAVYLALVAYASLYPFEGWRWPAGQSLGDLLALPWPPYRIPFDEWSNFFGYAPLGAVLATAWFRGGGSVARALAVGIAAPAAMSFAMEFVQHFVPGRHPSLRDWAHNTAGAVAGALLAAALHAMGLFDRWQRVRERWFVRDSSGAIALLVLWPVALLFPTPVPLGLGQIFRELAALVDAAFAGTPWSDAVHAAVGPEPPAKALTAAREAVVIGLGLLAPCLLASAVTRAGLRRVVMPVGAAVVALATMTLSTALNFGPEHALTWLSPATLPAIGAAALLAVLVSQFGQRVTLALGIAVLAALIALVADAPTDPYYAASLQGWEAGRFIRFHGLAQWVGWVWPYAAIAWLVARLARRD
jgi:VanZ family protein